MGDRDVFINLSQELKKLYAFTSKKCVRLQMSNKARWRLENTHILVLSLETLLVTTLILSYAIPNPAVTCCAQC
jgi:hypothetical protein